MRKMQYVDMSYYILRKDGEFAGVCMWSGPPEHPRRFAVHDGTKRYETAVALFQGKSIRLAANARGVPRARAEEIE